MSLSNAFVDPVKQVRPLKVDGESVLVGCKLPHGIVLELGKPGEDKYARVELAGQNTSHIAGGYGITRVSKVFMAEWMKRKENAKLSFVTKGYVFYHEQKESVESYFDSFASERTGLERLDPKTKMPKDLEALNRKD